MPKKKLNTIHQQKQIPDDFSTIRKHTKKNQCVVWNSTIRTMKYSQQRQTMKCNQHTTIKMPLFYSIKLIFVWIASHFMLIWNRMKKNHSKLVIWIIYLPFKPSKTRNLHFDIYFSVSFCHSLWRNVNCFDLCTLRCEISLLYLYSHNDNSPWHFHWCVCCCCCCYWRKWIRRTYIKWDIFELAPLPSLECLNAFSLNWYQIRCFIYFSCLFWLVSIESGYDSDFWREPK